MRLPQQVGDYTLLEQLGAGGFGTVYRARIEGEMGFAQDVALKIVDASRARQSPEIIQSLADEATFLARLQHAHIVGVRRFLRVEHPTLGVLWAMEMELVRGLVISRLLARLGATGTLLPVEAILSLLTEAAEALVYAHALTGDDGAPLGLVHRDIKPDNLIVTNDGRLKILDFGIAWAEDRLVASTESGLAKGTPLYMSPEQLHADPVDGRSDLYALGTVAFEFVTGERYVPVAARRLELPALIMQVARTRFADRKQTLQAALCAPAPAGRGLAAERVAPLVTLIGRLLDHDPAGRPASAVAFAHALEDLATGWRLPLGRRFLAAATGAVAPVDPSAQTAVSPAALSRRSTRIDVEDDDLAIESFATRLAEPPPTRPQGPSPEARSTPGEVAPTRAQTRPEPSSRRWIWPLVAVLAAVALAIALRPSDPEPVAELPPPTRPDPTLAVRPTPADPDPTPANPDPTPASDPSRAEATPAAPDPTPADPTPAEPTPRSPTPAPAPDPTPAPAPDPTPAPAASWPTLVGTPPGLVLAGNPLTLEVRLEGGEQRCTPEAFVRPVGGTWARRALSRRGGAWSVIMDIPYDETWDGGAEYFFQCCDDGGRCGASLGSRSAPLRAAAPSF